MTPRNPRNIMYKLVQAQLIIFVKLRGPYLTIFVHTRFLDDPTFSRTKPSASSKRQSQPQAPSSRTTKPYPFLFLFPYKQQFHNKYHITPTTKESRPTCLPYTSSISSNKLQNLLRQNIKPIVPPPPIVPLPTLEGSSLQITPKYPTRKNATTQAQPTTHRATSQSAQPTTSAPLLASAAPAKREGEKSKCKRTQSSMKKPELRR